MTRVTNTLMDESQKIPFHPEEVIFRLLVGPEVRESRVY